MDNKNFEYTVPEEYHLERIDKFLTQALESDFSRSYIQKLIKGENILVNSSSIKQNYKVKEGDFITIEIPEPEVLELVPQDIPIEIVYEDSSIAVINKQPGLVVHPGPGNWDRTLVNALLFKMDDLSSIGGYIRPGIVHRLDKDTSGLMIIAKNDVAHRNLEEQFAERKIRKKYTAIVSGKLQEKQAKIDLPVMRHPKYRHKMTTSPLGKEAHSEYRVNDIFKKNSEVFTSVDVKIYTGRTHQIRVHLSSMGTPIVGDPIYSKKWAKYRVPYLLLASIELGFTHPENGKDMHFLIERPAYFDEFMRKYGLR